MKFMAKVAKNSKFLLNKVPILRNSAKLRYKQKYMAHSGQKLGQNWSNCHERIKRPRDSNDTCISLNLQGCVLMLH